MKFYGKTSATLSVLIIASILLVAAAPVLAQGQQASGQEKAVPLSKVERKGKAPVSKEILRVKLPKPVEYTLENGLTVGILEDHRFPTVSVNLNISGAGALHEPAESPGLASFTAQMLREGTKTRTSRQIAEEIDRLGATVNVSAPFGSAATSLVASGLSDNMDDWMALFVDILMNPTFPAEELNKLKDRQKASLRQMRTQPSFLANERFSRAVYGSHPAAVVSTTPAAVDAMTPEKLAAWHRTRYSPQHAILGIAGDVSAAQLLPKLKKWFGAWPKVEVSDDLPPHPKAAAAKKIHIVNRPASVQTTLWVGNIAIDRAHPDYYALVVANRIFGGGPTGRLFLNLRENKGYTYGYYSGFRALRYPGAWNTSGDVRTEVTQGAITEVMNEINRLRNEKVPAEELEEHKRAIVAGFALDLESPTALLNNWITLKIYNFPPDYWDRYPERISAVTAEDVQRVAQKYLSPEALQIVAVGDATKIEPILKNFGPVEVWDTEGKPVPPRAASAASGK
jgi:zinc protease